MTRLMVNHHLH